MINYLIFITFHNFVELRQEIMEYIKHYFQAPFLSILQHASYQQVCVFQYA